MARVIITKELKKEIFKIFKKESIKVFNLIFTLKENPKKGKLIAVVGTIVLKEIKYKKYRFYFIADRYKIKFLKSDELKELLIKFVRMSDKKEQQQVIEEIKFILRNLGEEEF